MKPSDFEFTNPCLTKAKFDINDFFIPPQGEDGVELPIQMTVRPELDEKINHAKVGLDVVVGSEKENSPFIVCVSYQADFKWEDGAFTKEQITDLLKKNAAALLLSYVRPVVATMTSYSCFPAYNLPFVDFTKE